MEELEKNKALAERPLTKKERQRLRRQQKESERLRHHRQKKLKKILLIAVVALIVAGGFLAGFIFWTQGRPNQNRRLFQGKVFTGTLNSQLLFWAKNRLSPPILVLALLSNQSILMAKTIRFTWSLLA